MEEINTPEIDALVAKWKPLLQYSSDSPSAILLITPEKWNKSAVCLQLIEHYSLNNGNPKIHVPAVRRLLGFWMNDETLSFDDISEVLKAYPFGVKFDYKIEEDIRYFHQVDVGAEISNVIVEEGLVYMMKYKQRK